MSDPLDPAALLSRLPRLLPTDAQTLKNQYEALAALLHCVMISLDFRLVALDDESPAQEIAEGKLPLEWAKNGPSSFSFIYKHEQSSMIFYLKLVKMGNRVVVHGIALEVRRLAQDMLCQCLILHIPVRQHQNARHPGFRLPIALVLSTLVRSVIWRPSCARFHFLSKDHRPHISL
jgi:hypothetical protein